MPHGQAQIRNAELVRLLSADFITRNEATSVEVTLTRETIFTFENGLSVSNNPFRVYNLTGGAWTISEVFIVADTAPTGQSVIVDVHKDGTTIFTNQANRPVIAAAANTGNTTTIDVATWADGEYLTAHIDQVGNVTRGANLVVHIVHT